MTNAQTEARAMLAGLIVAFNSDVDRHVLIDRIATALAAKDAELAEARADALKVGDQMLAEKFRADRAEASLAEARKALEPFALVAEHDIGEDEADSDAFRPMPKPFNHAPQITVGHLRAALAVLREAK